MQTADVLEYLGRLLNDVDPLALQLDDTERLQALEDARRQLAVRNASNLSAVAIDVDAGTITPDLTDTQVELVCHQAAANILDQMYVERVRRGELGVTWMSGLESESTITQQKAYKAAIDALRDVVETIKLIGRAPTAGFRAQ